MHTISYFSGAVANDFTQSEHCLAAIALILIVTILIWIIRG